MQVVGFLSRQPGREAPSALLLATFEAQLPASPSSMHTFRSVLRQVAKLRKQAGEGIWVLRPEF
jgi:hypothetical protein